MIATALIVFREVLEAALIVGIVSAATRGIPGRGRWIGAGLGAGLLGSVLVAAGAGAISQLAEGMGQELFNAAILSIAVLMLAWHNIWMTSHGRELAANARRIGADVRSGASKLSIVLVVIGVAVLREGAETVLFLYGIAASGDAGRGSMVGGGLIGLAGGVLVGVLLFKGLLRIPLKWFFSVTSALVLLLAAGMAAQAARFLVQANVLPSLASPVWDTSSVVSNTSMLGKALTGLVGYDAQPAGMQIAAWIAVLAAIATGMALVRRRDGAAPSAPPASPASP
ncbi:MAG TPA: FTR1 family protein [Usitatibacter sp.]|jgi:high-affinity iron transporter|nr:FTR1 family protein [Usitatibacter sp.]